MAEKLSVPFLNRLVDAMFGRADPKADQNIWDLARAAEEVCREVKGEQLVAAYGGPLSPVAAASGPPNHWAPRPQEWGGSPTGRIHMSQVPLTQPGRADQTVEPDYAALLGEVERRLMLKAPQYTGDTATKVDALAQDFQAAAKQIEQQNQGIEKLKRELREKDAAFQDVIGQIRGALDPDGQFEDESLIVLARERMNALAARKQDLVQLQERISTQIEANSAEMLRRVLGAAANETLGAAAKRVREERDGARSRVDREIGEHVDFEREIRKLVRAQPEIDSDDCYCPEQPTLDAVNRVIQRLMANESRIDGSLTQEQVLDEIQQGWHDDNHGELQL
jgi:hypothetical protein